MKQTPTQKRITEIEQEINRLELAIFYLEEAQYYGETEVPTEEDFAKAYGELSDLNDLLQELRLEQAQQEQKDLEQDHGENLCNAAIDRDIEKFLEQPA